MPPKAQRTLSARHDDYAEHRCECQHLIYANQKPGDPCMFCSCTAHVAAGTGKAAGP